MKGIPKPCHCLSALGHQGHKKNKFLGASFIPPQGSFPLGLAAAPSGHPSSPHTACPPCAPSSPLTVTSSRAGALPSPTPGCTQRCQAPPDHERASRPWGRPGCSWRLCPCSALAVVFALDLNRSAERFVGRKWSQLLSLLITWRQIARRVGSGYREARSLLQLSTQGFSAVSALHSTLLRCTNILFAAKFGLQSPWGCFRNPLCRGDKWEGLTTVRPWGDLTICLRLAPSARLLR